MADKQVPFSDMDEEEFHISDDDIDHELDNLDDDLSAAEEASHVDATSAQEEKKKGGFLKGLLTDRKRLVIVLIVVFAIVYAVSKLFSAKHQSMDDIQPISHPVSTKTVVTEPREKMLANVQTTVDTSAKTEPMPVTTNAVAPMASEPVAPTMPVLTTQPAPSSTPAQSAPQKIEDHALTQQLQTLEKNNQLLANQLAEVSAQLVQVTSAMNNLNNKVDNIAKQPVTPAVATAKALPKLVTDQRYYVEAVVPGRAWIQTDNGETITVTIGEEIKGLGNVVSIEPATGEVVTTSGEIIKYGPY